MKLWKILLATMIAMLLVCAVAMADTCEEGCTPSKNFYVVTEPTCEKTGLMVQYACKVSGCDNTTKALNAQPIPALGHNWSETKVVAATCTAEGSKTFVCLNDGCNATKTETIAKEKHNLVKSNQLSTPATCTKAGEDVSVCADCYEVVTKVVAATGHTWTSVDGVAATCTKDGYTRHQECACGAINGGAVIPALGHDFSVLADSSKQKATCTEDGYKLYKCSRCTETEKVITETAKGHVVTRVVEEVKATCTEAGYISYACANCYDVAAVKVTTDAAKGHVMTRKVSEVAATCTEAGYISYACANCYDADAVKVTTDAATGHNFSVKINEAKVTCTTDGYTEYACANNCGNTEKRDIVAKTGHNHETLIENILPTCTQAGYEAYKCACGDIKYNAVAVLAHNYSDERWTEKVAPTCLSAGTESNVCTMCDKAEIIRVVAATGHELVNDKLEKQPTCTEDGLRVKKCANEGCKYEETVVLKALGHKEKDTIVAKADCVNVGMKHVSCERCGEQLAKNVIIPAEGHTGKVTKEVAATCTTEGSKTTECTKCNKTVTETIAKLAHAYTWVTTAATPSANGKSEYKCSACGDVAEVKTIKYSKWYYNNTMTSFGPTTKELVGGNDWYRVTPVDLAVDGVYTYDLIASNKYVVGTVTITVNAGALTVSYKTNYSVDVKDEALLIYASKADLATGTAVTAPVGAAINAAETFGADTKVLVSLILTGDYDAAGKGLVDASAAAGMIANID